MRISSHKTSNVQYFIFSYLCKPKNMLGELLGCKKKYCRLNITGADAAQHLKLFSLCKAQFAEYQMKKMHYIFLCTAATSLSIVSNFTSVFSSSFLFSSPQIQISKFRKCMYVGCCNRIFFACLTPSSLSLIRSVSRKPLCKTELLDYNTFSAKKNPNKQKKIKQGKKQVLSPLPGIEPGSPA